MSFKPRSRTPAGTPSESPELRRRVDSLIRKLTRRPRPGDDPWMARFLAARDLAALGGAARRAVPPLLRTIDDPDNDSLPHFAAAVTAIAGPAGVASLLERRPGDDRLRAGWLVDTVVALGEPAAPELLRALDHGQALVRQGAALVLGRLGHAPAVDRLLALLEDPEPAVALAAAEALGRIGDPRAVAPLLDLFRRSAPVDRRPVAIALEGCGHQPSSPADPSRIDALIGRHDWDGLAALGAAAVDYLLHISPDPNPYLRGSIIEVLGRIGDRRAVGYLLEELDQPFRGYAVVALGRIGDPRATVPLRAMLVADLSTGPGPAAPFLAEALGRLGDRESVEPLTRCLDEGQPTLLRCRAARALGRIGEARVADRLTPWLDQPDRELRAAAAEALDRLTPAADLDDRIRRLIAGGDWTALIAVGPTAVAPILAGLGGQPAEIQSELIRVLGRIGDPSAATAVIDWLFDHPDLVTDATTLQQWDRAMYSLFRVYTGMVLAVSCAVRRTKRVTESTPYREDYDWIYDHSWIDHALRDLEQLDTAIAVDLLHRVATKPDPEVEIGYLDREMYPGPIRGSLSFAEQRERARRELARRGDPPADPTVYLRPGELQRIDRVAPRG